ncbi:MAG TPA: UDP-glucose--hexose-1-phosphate uridylyltransferase [Kiritimatiellia bacterium]|nr:UDP-glucose--hexose-1-phosphate uridylyltransferase [Kiritimatiellia bacterium]HMO97604.1 UDP-glucose--hexose-1-phosphate uridylyltransferase [Kiritimatiellia bacterium]HMP95964.1 UDP-glucose--hexose-1-phosphate uridylyltransferase [Kiritimatiellia bacterium]
MSPHFPHRRFNLLTGDWVLVSPHRTQRPWQGRREPAAPAGRPTYDPACYLCPGNQRANGERNPDYVGTFVFPNDFPALLPEVRAVESKGLFRSEAASGVCRVICFSPRHDLTLPRMPTSEIRRVVDCWAEQVDELSRTYRWVQVFENKGEVMGCSNPHPHGQIWAGNFLPNEPAKEDARQREYLQSNGRILLMDVLREEQADGRRIILENEYWTAMVPFWAVWPYEMLILPRRHVLRLPDLTGTERDALADVLKKILSRYDNLFETSFPYSMGWHGAPGGDERDVAHWQLHAHIFPPLLRSATVKKFMVGYEMLAEAQRDLTPEQAAEKLRSLSNTHYLDARP